MGIVLATCRARIGLNYYRQCRYVCHLFPILKGEGRCGKVGCPKLGRTMSVGGDVCLLLQVCMVVLILLLVAGDVERNPGPTENEDQVNKVLPTVDDSPLEENDLFDLLSELMPAVASWKAIGEGLHLSSGTLEEIETVYDRIPRNCMSAVLRHWLRKNYNVQRFGEPTWQTMVKVVAHFAAGNNCALALCIAGKHSDHDDQDGTTHDPVNDDHTPPAKRRRTKSELRETSPFSPEEKVLPVDEATLAKEQGQSQSCLRDANFGSQYVIPSFQLEDEIHSSSDPSSFQPQYGSIPTKEEYRVLLEKHHPDIEEHLDLPSLIPRLNAHHLLTLGQAEYLSNELYTHSQRVVKLLEYIQRKGVEGYRRFLRAIGDETTHIGHKELYAILAKSKPSKLLDRKLKMIGHEFEGKRKTH